MSDIYLVMVRDATQRRPNVAGIFWSEADAITEARCYIDVDTLSDWRPEKLTFIPLLGRLGGTVLHKWKNYYVGSGDDPFVDLVIVRAPVNGSVINALAQVSDE